VSVALTASDVLSVWERGRDRHPVDRALLILAAAYPELGADELPALPVGTRDARLLDVRAATFGSRLDATAACPRCAVALEFVLEAGRLRLPPGAAPEPWTWRLDDYVFRLRCPDSRDLADAVRRGNMAAARESLLAGCVLEARRERQPVTLDALPAAVVDAVVERIAEADPQADITLSLSCPECGHDWEAILDIASFLWAELAARARQLAGEVHDLARRYGWPEADILAMSPARRQLYLELRV
jgi:hypothetical protein